MSLIVHTASLKDLTFIGYDYDLKNQKIVSILTFDRSKVSSSKQMTIISRFYLIINHFLLVLKFFVL